MHLYLYETRLERRQGLIDELNSARIHPVTIGAEFFMGDLAMLSREGSEARPFLLADLPDTPEIVARMRAAGARNPVLVLRDFRNSRAAAKMLDLGADDDLVVPVKAIELRSRINAITRRSHGHTAESVTIGEVTAYFDGRDPEVAGQRIKLSRREHAIFQQLALNACKVISKAAIYDAVYGMADEQPFDKVIDVYICKIRKKIDTAAPSGHQYIETVHGRGYKLAPAEGDETLSLPPAVAAVQEARAS